VKREAGVLADQGIAHVVALGAREDGRDVVALVCKHTVQAAHDGYRQDHVAVLVGRVDAAELVRDGPDQGAEAAHRVGPLGRAVGVGFMIHVRSEVVGVVSTRS